MLSGYTGAVLKAELKGKLKVRENKAVDQDHSSVGSKLWVLGLSGEQCHLHTWAAEEPCWPSHSSRELWNSLVPSPSPSENLGIRRRKKEKKEKEKIGFHIFPKLNVMFGEVIR